MNIGKGTVVFKHIPHPAQPTASRYLCLIIKTHPKPCIEVEMFLLLSRPAIDPPVLLLIIIKTNDPLSHHDAFRISIQFHYHVTQNSSEEEDEEG